MARIEFAYCHIPELRTAPPSDRDRVFPYFEDPVFEKVLPVGLRVRVLPRRVFSFDCSGWKAELAAAMGGAAFDDKISQIARCTSLLNAHLACLYTALQKWESKYLWKHMSLSATDVLTIDYTDQGTSGVGKIDPDGLHMLDLWLQDKGQLHIVTEISRHTIEQSLMQLNDILADSADYLLTVVELYLRASTAMEQHDYVLSLTLGWTAVERLLRGHWEKYLARNRERVIGGSSVKFINSNRDQRLQSRDYSAFVISETLSLVGDLPFDVYESMTRARVARNSWLHGLKAVTRSDANEVLKTAWEMLKLMHKLDLSWPMWLQA